MRITQPFPKQPHLFISYLCTAKLLLISMVLFIFEAYIYWIMLVKSMAGQSNFKIAFWSVFFLFSFTHIFLVLADSWSRFQDYKRVKDQLFMYGFQKKIIRQYALSKCQRYALTTAARELNMHLETKKYLFELGYRWYHFIPDFMVKDPLFIFKKYYWDRTFHQKYYKSKFDYQQLSLQSIKG